MSTNAIAYALTTCPQFVTFTGRNAEWEDAHIPRTDRPARFCYLSGAAIRPCIARGYMGYALPVRFR